MSICQIYQFVGVTLPLYDQAQDLSTGTLGSDYNVTCRIVTADGRTDDRTIRIIVQDQ